jgi:signal transduction histidine kinase
VLSGLLATWLIAYRRRLEAIAVRKHNEQLQKEVTQRNDLMGIVAHDLRNPLTVLSLGFEAISMGDTTDSETQFLSSQMTSSVDDMIDIIDRSLLNCREQISQDTELTFKPRCVDAGALARGAVNDYSRLASKKNIRLRVEIPDQQCLVIADDGLIRQVLANLISNALKFSHPDSSVWVRVTNSQQGTVCISVQDEGLGLSEDDVKRCFGRFEKLSASPTGSEPSSGLGLYNARKLAETMGGTLAVTSAGKNRGATFTMTLPQHSPPVSDMGTPPASSLFPE